MCRNLLPQIADRYHILEKRNRADAILWRVPRTRISSSGHKLFSMKNHRGGPWGGIPHQKCLFDTGEIPYFSFFIGLTCVSVDIKIYKYIFLINVLYFLA